MKTSQIEQESVIVCGIITTKTGECDVDWKITNIIGGLHTFSTKFRCLMLWVR